MIRFWFKQFFSDRKAHKLALYEVVVVCGISLLPLLALAVIDKLPADPSLEQLFWDAISSGQLYLYSFSLFGTLSWLCHKEHENFTRFEPRLLLFFLMFIPCVLILVIYGHNPTMTKPLAPTFVSVSFYVYVLYSFLYYVLLVFDHLVPPPVEQGLQQAAETLIAEYEQTGGTT